MPDRRRKKETLDVVGKRLAVNHDLLDLKNFKYRFINDTPARLFALTKQDDWDIVTDDGGVLKEDATDLGNAVSVIVGTSKDGSGIHAYLCRKPLKWWESDQAQKQTDLDEQLESLKRGLSAKGENQGDYIPNEGIKLA